MTEMSDLEGALEMKFDTPPQVLLCLNQEEGIHLKIWTWSYDDNAFLLVARLMKGESVYRAWADAVRDYIDMTHLRNWIVKDCADVMDSNGRMILEKFMKRYKYERPAKAHAVYQVIK